MTDKIATTRREAAGTLPNEPGPTPPPEEDDGKGATGTDGKGAT